MNRVVKIVLGLVLVAAVAAGSFYGGLVYGEDRAQPAFSVPEGFAQRSEANQGEMPPGGRSGVTREQGGMLAGEIVSVGDGRLTLEDESGDEIVVHVTDTTYIQKQADVTLADLQAGETVFVSGSRGDDGSITARMVQVSSATGLGLPGGFPAGGQPVPGESQANP